MNKSKILLTLILTAGLASCTSTYYGDEYSDGGTEIEYITEEIPVVDIPLGDATVTDASFETSGGQIYEIYDPQEIEPEPYNIKAPATTGNITSTTVFQPPVAKAASKGNGFYVGGLYQMVFSDIDGVSEIGDYDNRGYGGKLGYEVDDSWRVEAELFHRDNDFAPDGRTNIKENGIALNAIKTLIDNEAAISPYVGVGVGAVELKYDDKVNPEVETNSYLYQGLAGIDFNLDTRNRMSLGYRYANSGEADIDASGSQNIEVETHSAEVSYTLDF